jgi:hypothetical protein
MQRDPSKPSPNGSPESSRIATGMRESNSIDSFRRKKASSPAPDAVRGSSELGRGIANVTRKPSSMSKRLMGHDRKDSGLSLGGRSSGQGRSEEGRSGSQDDVDEFDALVRSGETMKVSLTPSRLKTFDVSRFFRVSL